MSRPPSDPEAQRRAMLRGFCLVGGGLAAAVAVLGFCPGYEIHRGGRLVEVAAVASAPVGLAAALAIFAGIAAAVWRRPLIAHALLGVLGSIGVSVFVLALTAAPFPEPGARVVALPAAAASNRLVLALVVVQLALLPIACALQARVIARRPDRLAPARVHRLGRG